MIDQEIPVGIQTPSPLTAIESVASTTSTVNSYPHAYLSKFIVEGPLAGNAKKTSICWTIFKPLQSDKCFSNGNEIGPDHFLCWLCFESQKPTNPGIEIYMYYICIL